MNSATAQSDKPDGADLEPCKLIEILAGNPVVLFAMEDLRSPFDRSELLLPPVSH